MIKPVNNYCLIEVLDEYSSLATTTRDEQKGIVREVSFSTLHITASTGFKTVESDEETMQWVADLKSWIGKTVRYALYADADSTQFKGKDKKRYVLIPWYRIMGVENEAAE